MKFNKSKTWLNRVKYSLRIVKYGLIGLNFTYRLNDVKIR